MAYSVNQYLAMNSRIFAEAEAMGIDIMTICSTCLMVMSTAAADIKSGGLLERTNAVLSKAGLRYGGGVRIRQFLGVLHDDYGVENLARKVVKPLSWLKAAPFYGCHSLRPSDALGFDDPQRPAPLEAVIRAIGAEPVDYIEERRSAAGSMWTS